MYDNTVDLDKAEYLIITNNPYGDIALGYRNLKDAEMFMNKIDELKQYRGGLTHYLVKVMEHKTVGL